MAPRRPGRAAPPVAAGPCIVERARAAEVAAVAEPLFREYGRWVADGLRHHHGIVLTDADLERHHEAFRAEAPALLGPRGRLLVARLGEEPVGVAALKPVDGATAEVKRVYVRPEHHGRGVGRLLLRRIVHDAGAERYRTVRLETADFMTAALGLYRSAGFVDIPPFDGSEMAGTVLHLCARYLQLALGEPGGPG